MNEDIDEASQREEENSGYDKRKNNKSKRNLDDYLDDAIDKIGRNNQKSNNKSKSKTPNIIINLFFL